LEANKKNGSSEIGKQKATYSLKNPSCKVYCKED